MRKTWLVARWTYSMGVRSSTFLMVSLGLPLLMLLSAGIVALQVSTGNLPVLGYVDQSGTLSPIDELKVDGEILVLKSFPDVATARSAQVEGTVEAYLVVPDGYFRGEAVRYYGKKDPRGKVEDAIEAFIRRSLLPDAPLKTLELLGSPLTGLVFVESESGATIHSGLPQVVRAVFPFIIAAMFGFLVMTNSSQMGIAMAREKDQRVMEMVLTSLPAWQLVAGKIIGITLLSLTQIVVWAIGGSLALLLAISQLATGETIVLPFDILGWAAALFVPGYFLYATLAAGVGIVAGNPRQAQQVTGALGVLAMTPFFVLQMVIDTPNESLAVFLSLFPLTAPMVAVLRMGATSVPVWQLLLAIGLLVLALLGSTWFVAQLFRSAILLYGQPLRPRALLRALRGSQQRIQGELR